MTLCPTISHPSYGVSNAEIALKHTQSSKSFADTMPGHQMYNDTLANTSPTLILSNYQWHSDATDLM